MSRFNNILLVLFVSVPLAAQTVSNVEVQQKGDQIEVSYTLDKEADTYLSVTLDGKYSLCKSTSGDIGINISAGRHVVTWNVLADMDDFVGEAYFEIHASQSTRDKKLAEQARQRKQAREERMKGIFPLAGFDVSFGFYGLGGSIYWPWVTQKHSRVGSYFSYVYGTRDWKDSNVSGFHNLGLGLTVTVSQHVALFAAPGLSIVKSRYEVPSTRQESGSSSSITTYNYAYSTDYKFMAEGGISFKLLFFSLSVKYAYPSYLGFGLGLDFGWLP